MNQEVDLSDTEPVDLLTLDFLASGTWEGLKEPQLLVTLWWQSSKHSDSCQIFGNSKEMKDNLEQTFKKAENSDMYLSP